jgi:hypothetical protein
VVNLGKQLGLRQVLVTTSQLAVLISLLGVAQRFGRPIRPIPNSSPKLVEVIVLLKQVTVVDMEALPEGMALGSSNGECRQVTHKAVLVTLSLKTIRQIMHSTIKINTLNSRSALLLIDSDLPF